MIEWYIASVSRAVDLGLILSGAKTNDFKFSIHSFPA